MRFEDMKLLPKTLREKLVEQFGDNCSDILLEIAKGKEIDLYLSHVLHFNEENFEAYSKNLHRPYNSYEEYISEAVKGVVGCI